MAVLVSFIGGSDPIRTEHDGPLLHIMRYYTDIDVIYVYLTKKVSEIHNNPNKNYYRIAFNNFMEKNNRKIDIKYIDLKSEKNLEKDDPSDYDEYFNFLCGEMKKIIKNHPNERIYFNTSSGTPQMTLNLILLYHNFDYNNLIKTIKVKNFNIDMSKKTPDSLSDEYNFEEEQFFNCDETNNINRASITNTFCVLKNNRIKKIEGLLENCDYQAILDLYKNFISNEYALGLLEFQKNRCMLSFENAKKILESHKIKVSDYLPLYYGNYDEHKRREFELFEYYLNMKNLIKAKRYNDFLIRIDVFFIELLKEILFKKFSFDISKYETIENGKTRKLSFSKISQYEPDIANAINNAYNCNYYDSELNIHTLVAVINFFASEEDKAKMKFLDYIEKLHDLRNTSAHKLTMINAEEINRFVSDNKLMTDIEGTMMWFNEKIEGNYFNLYKKINKDILDLIK